ncbi:hypothetical protein GDO81_023083 [Engystomops pustulosus]|uniref:Fibrinogen C-terminal domain-containing protein n=1 Tax=Engystomops pustulosus TaxID=76066 RepID=A0AAV6ZIN6_ENGPU|nr:hypothetical protein GDO81_023083 [Engystomops pustulosus]
MSDILRVSGLQCAKGDKGEHGEPGNKENRVTFGAHIFYFNFSLCLTAARNCKSVLEKGFTLSDWYIIYPDGKQPLRVLCDMHTDGGGWILCNLLFVDLTERYDGSVDFLQDWESYKKGFGNRLSEFGLGNDNNKIKFISSFKVMERVEIQAVCSGAVTGDSLSYHNGKMFSTPDQDNDPDPTNCANVYKGTWWHNKCHFSNLNGLYLPGKHDTLANGINWQAGKGYNYSYRRSEMKIRRVK